MSLLSWIEDHIRIVLSVVRKYADLSMLPWQEGMTLEPVRQLLNATGQTQQERTRIWKDAKLAELHYFGLTSALIAASLSSAFSWNVYNELLPVVQALWFSALILVLTSIIIALQQTTALYRLSSNSDGMDSLRKSLGYLDGQQLKPRKLQVFIWQTSGLLLNGSIGLFGIGLLLQIWIGYARTGQKIEVTIYECCSNLIL